MVRSETPELNRRINTLIMRGLPATDAETQAKAEAAREGRPGRRGRPDYHKDAPVPVRFPADLLAWIDGQEGSRSSVIIKAVQEKRQREGAG